MAQPVLPLPRLVYFSKSVTDTTFSESVHLALKSGTEYRYRQTETGEEIREIVSRSTRVVWLVNVTTKETILEVYPLLPELQARLADGTLKIFFLNTARHPKLRDLVRSRPGVEVIDPPITTKALQYKLKNAVISVHQTYIKNADLLDGVAVVGSEAKNNLLRPRPRILGAEVLWQPPFELNVDFWWIPDGKSIRLVLGVWLIDLIGPSTAAGVWEESAAESGINGEKVWFWKNRWLSEEVFQTRKGRWLFFGRQIPEYSATKNAWLFIGKNPRLAYFEDDQPIPKMVRFEYREDEGFIACENSLNAKALLPRIRETFIEEAPKTFLQETETPDQGGRDEFSLLKETAREETPAALVLRGSSDTAKNSGIAKVEAPGVSAGVHAFQQTSMGVEVLRKNGEPLTHSRLHTLVYDLGKTNATFAIDFTDLEIGDRFHFRLKLGFGDSCIDCVMEWELGSILMVSDGKTVARGEFVSGDFAPLAHAMDRMQERKRELKEFYRLARG